MSNVPRPTLLAGFRQHPRALQGSLLAVLLVGYFALAGYLARPAPFDGDGAVYTIQALTGSPWQRSLHVGYLAPLWAWTRWTGRDPALLGALWTGLALVLSTALGERLLREHARARARAPSPRLLLLAPLLAPLSLLAGSQGWRSAAAVEIHGLLGALLIGATLALGRGRGVTAGLLLAWAGLVHPAAWVALPGLLLLCGEPERRTVARAVGVGVGLHLLALALLWPDWWNGGRGLLETAASDRNPWQSLQEAWRLIARDLGPAALPLLAGLLAAPRRRLAGLGLVVLGSALLLDRHSDNPGQLPALWLGCCFAPLAALWLAELREPRPRRLAAVATLALLLLGVAEGTSRHDGAARAAERHARSLLEGGCGERPELDWADRSKLELLCLDR